MRINKDWKELLGILLSIILGIGFIAASFTGLYYLVQFIWFLQDNNFFEFPIWTFLIVTVLGGMFINSIYNELKFNKSINTFNFNSWLKYWTYSFSYLFNKSLDR